jgi:ABC-type amino acid transport substrate-binding protein
MIDPDGRLVTGRYRLRDQLGSGGMGTVWRATDEFLEREVAIKEVTLLNAVEESAPAFQRTLREARVSARLRHPNIVTVYDVVLEAGRPWIVMELIDGPSLAEVVERDGPLTERRVTDIARQLLAALASTHDKGILHRDVKPANVLLDGDRVVLTDFGIAVVEGGTALTATNQLIGSPQYLPPERINGQEAGAPSDLWALGVTLFYAITGKSPFQRDDVQSVFAAVLIQDAPPVPGALGPLIEGLLRKDPAKRLTAAGAVALLGHGAEPTRPITREIPGTQLAPRRRRRQIVVALGLVVALAATAVLWIVLSQQQTSESALDRMTERGSVIIGVRGDQPGLGWWDSVSQSFTGFEVEIGKRIAAGLGFAEDRITFKAADPAQRENALATGEVDMAIGSYPITEDNKRRVSFAGPYLTSGPSLLVRKEDEQGIRPGSLRGRKVCAVGGTFAAQYLQAAGEVEPSGIVLLESLDECRNALNDKRADAISSDDAILTAYASVADKTYTVFTYSTLISVEYGIGLGHDEKPLRDKVNNILTNAFNDGTWLQIYERTLGYADLIPKVPTVKPY